MSQARLLVARLLIVFFVTCTIIVVAANVAMADALTDAAADSATNKVQYFKATGPTREEVIQKIKIEQKDYWKNPLSYEDLEKRELVEKVPDMTLPGTNKIGYKLVPYRIRRDHFDNQVTLTASEYSPTNYQTDYLNPDQGTFSQLYSSSAVPMVEASYMLRYNFLLGAIALEGGYGYYKANSKSIELGSDTLVGQETRVGLRYIMDTVWREPIVAPYVMGGAYQFQYSETQGNAKLQGRTNFAPYWGAGVLLQLNWLDTEATVDGYKSAGIENWYLFAEARDYMSTGDVGANEKDFSSPLSLAMGLSIEL